MDTVDTDTQKRYSAGSDAVEVSEAFAERIGKSKAYGTAFEFEGESGPLSFTTEIDNSEMIEKIKAEFIEQFKGELKELEDEHEAEIKLKNAEIADLKSQLELATKTDNPDAEKQAVKDEYELLLGNKPGNKSIDTMKAEIDAFKAESK